MSTSLRRPRPAAAVLASPFVAAVLVLGLAACGSDAGDDTATDPAGSSTTPSQTPSGSPSETPTETPTESSGGSGTIEAIGSAGVTEAQLVSQTDAGGTASEMAFALDTDQAVTDFVAGLAPDFAATVTDTVAQVAADNPDATPYAAVAAIGCEAPRSVAIDAGEAGFMVVPKLPKSNIQCFAAETYVVVFAAPDA
jgi:hypothetical protein